MAVIKPNLEKQYLNKSHNMLIIYEKKERNIFWHTSPRSRLHLPLQLPLFLIWHTTLSSPLKKSRAHMCQTQRRQALQNVGVYLTDLHYNLFNKIRTIWVGSWTEDGLDHVLLIAMFCFRKSKQYGNIPLTCSLGVYGTRPASYFRQSRVCSLV